MLSVDGHKATASETKEACEVSDNKHPGSGWTDLDDLDVHGARNGPANRVAYGRMLLGPFDYLTQLLGGYTFGAKTNHDADGERTRELGAC